MAPVVPFIPLIAAGVGAAGAITAAGIAAKGSKKAAAASALPKAQPLSVDPKTSMLQDPATTDDKRNLRGVLPIATGPLGDTTSPALNRSKLLGN